MILELCHSWGRDEAWFYDLPSGEQVKLLGWWRSRIPQAPTRPTKGPRPPSTAARALARQVAHQRQLRDNVSVANKEAESFWLGD